MMLINHKHKLLLIVSCKQMRQILVMVFFDAIDICTILKINSQLLHQISG